MSSISVNTASSGAGLDVQATVDQLIYAERAPERLWQKQQALLENQASALEALQEKAESLEDAVNDLKDFSGALSSRSAASSDTSLLTASAEASASSGIHTIVVEKLATYGSRYSKAIADPNFLFAEGATLSLTVGADSTVHSFDLGGKTLQEAASSINDLNTGIRANVVSDANGSRLSLVSKTIGVPGSITLTADTSGLEWEGVSAGENAQLVVDGIPIESTSNTVTGVITGVTLRLANLDATRTVTLNVGPDTAKAKQAIKTFVDCFNSILSGINAQFNYSDSRKTAGVLAGDSTVRLLQSVLLGAISYSVSGNSGFGSLRSVGIEMENDGTLTIDDSVLEDAVQNHYTEFESFFQSVAPDGFARHFGAQLANVNDSVSGAIAVDLKGIAESSKDIAEQIDDFEVRISFRQQQLIDQYSRIDMMLRQFPVTQAQLTAQLGSLNSK